MVTETDLAQTQLSMRYELSPVKNIIGDLSGLIASFCDEFLCAFYTRNTGKRANIVVTELFDNAVRNNSKPESNILLELAKDTDSLTISVGNRATKKQFATVRDHIEMINKTEDKRQLLAETINERRRERKRGGLGLMRLVAENKFDITVAYDEGMLRVTAVLDTGGAR